AVIALPVGKAGTRDHGLEALASGRREHAHETAVTPAHHAEPRIVDRQHLLDFVDAGQYVIEIAVTHLLADRLRVGFALAETAARVGHQHEVTEFRQHRRAAA